MSDIRVVRSFLPVGQGAFYCERFYNTNCENIFTAVYDCGSKTISGKPFERLMEDNSFVSKDKIRVDIIFISHFDDDHVNGLETLLSKCDYSGGHCVKLFLPVVNPDEKKLLLLRIEDRFAARLLTDISSVKARFGNLKIIEVEVWGEGERNRESRPIQVEDLDSDGAYDKISSGTVIRKVLERREDNEIEWQYIPFNRKLDDTVLGSLLKSLKNYSPQCKAYIECNGALTKSEKNDIRKKFQDELGKLNSHSMVVYSGYYGKNQCMCSLAAHIKCGSCLHGICSLCYDRLLIGSGCLYTGDYNANAQGNFKDLHEFYCRQWATIGCFQIPHHGSKQSFSPEFLKDRGNSWNVIYVASAGINNQYGHPHGSVVMDFLLKEKMLHVVSECANSRLDMICYIK